MKIFVTGGTGFVGSHIVAALVGAGHEVRLLVRRPEQVPLTFGPHGIEPTDLVVGDVRDADLVARGIEGCDAVVHAAAIYSLHRKDVPAIAATNVAAARTVLDAAVTAGADPVVHISSTVALIRGDGGAPDLPLGDLSGPYASSKRDSEVIAREHQSAAAPVVSIYPGGVYGPKDPYLSDQNNRLVWVARGLFPLWSRGAYHVCDVRDVAATVVAVMRQGQGPRRYVVPGTHMSADTLFAALSSVLGRRRPYALLPDALAWPIVRSTGVLNSLTPRRWYYPADEEGIAVSVADMRLDDGPARLDLGITPYPFEETMRDTVGWLVDAGHLPSKLQPR